jgi:hypothetical protein
LIGLEVNLVIRPITHGAYIGTKVDAISCTFDVDGFTLMNAVLIAHGFNRGDFENRKHLHTGALFRVITHSDTKPLLVTTTKTERWESEPTAAEQVIRAVGLAQCESLCMTHFAFILGRFPGRGFTRCLSAIAKAKHHAKPKRIVVDVDERYLAEALRVQHSIGEFNPS